VRADADRDLGAPAAQAAAHPQHAPAGLDDPAHVAVLLGRQPDHEVELEAMPAAREHPPRALLDVRLGDVLVDHVAHALRAGLGRERQPADPGQRQLVEQILVEPVRAQRRHRHRHAALAQLPRERLDQRRDAGKIRRRQTREPGLFVARALDAADQRVGDRLRRALPHRPVDHAGLAEPAALGAAARDLDRRALEHRLGVRHRRVAREWILIEIGHHRAADPRRRPRIERRADHRHPGRRVDLGRVQRGHVEREPARELGQRVAARASTRGDLAAQRGPRQHERRQQLLGLADERRVDERRDRLGVRRRRAADQHQRRVLGALGRAQRDAPEIEQREHVGERQLVLQRDADHVELAQRALGLERHQRQPARAQLGLHVGPRRERALARDPGIAIEQRIDDLGPQVRHPDVVDIRKREADAGLEALDAVPGVLLDHGLVLAAEVPHRLGDAIDEVCINVSHEAVPGSGCV
jgi:hypothetical protein